MKQRLFLLFFIFVSVAAAAQLPREFTYQMVLRDGNDILLTNQNVGLLVAFRQGAADGTVVYSETHSVTTNSNGLVTLVIGQGTPVVGSIGSIDWSAGLYYLVVDVDPAGGTNYEIQAARKLMPVPYALYAESSGSGGGGGASDVSRRYVDSLYATLMRYQARDTIACIASGSIVWRGRTYNATGIYNDTISSDSIIRMALTVGGGTHRRLDTAVCQRYVWHGDEYTTSVDGQVYEYVDANGCPSADTLHLTIKSRAYYTDDRSSNSSYTWINGVTYSTSVYGVQYAIVGGATNGCDSIVTLNLTIGATGAINSLFSISASTKVLFAKGNLQYQASTGTWRFAEHQYDIIGSANSNISSSYSGWIDLLGWGTSGWNSGASSYQPYSTSTSEVSYYLGGSSGNNLSGVYSYADWGVYNRISNGGNACCLWRTPTTAEYGYVFNTRRASTVGGVANARFCKARIGSINGVILFPDIYTHPAGVMTPARINEGGVSYATNIYTTEQWDEMEAAGAVFLPAAGYRSGTTMYSINSDAYYHTANVNGTGICTMEFYDGSVAPMATDGRYYGFAIRLIQESVAPSYATDIQEACDSFTWINGVTYTETTNTPTHVIPGGNARGCDSIVTLNLIIHNATTSVDVQSSANPFTWIDGNTYSEPNHDATYTIAGGNMYGCDSIITLCFSMPPHEGRLNGLVSIAPNQKVQFSQGNLQYQASTGTWRFAINQYDIIGNGNRNISSSYTGWIDLFGWGTSGWNSGANSYMPYSTSTNNADYQPGGSSGNDLRGLYVAADWGQYNPISNGGNRAGMWRTLKANEWRYLFDTRTASTISGTENGRFCKARVNGVNGVIIFPDQYTHPDGYVAPRRINNKSASYSTNIINAIEWDMMVQAGAVFLPASGYRNGASMSCLPDCAYYWTSDHIDGNTVYTISFSDGGIDTYDPDGRYYGFASRLVYDSVCPSYYTDVHEACDSFVWIDGNTYTESTNSATHIIEGGNRLGFDSVITLNLTIKHSSSSIDAHITTSSYRWMDDSTYTETTGMPTYVIANGNAVGCDSTIRLALQIIDADGTLPGEYSIASGATVRFSRGNLQYQANTRLWRFAENQYDCIGGANSSVSSTYTGWIDLFGWGTSGWNSGANSYMPYSTSTSEGDYSVGGNIRNSLIDEYAEADWGVHNPISNGGNVAGKWRVLRGVQWAYLFNTRNASTIDGTSNARFCTATVNGMKGVIIFADNYVQPSSVASPTLINNYNANYTNNTYNLAEWAEIAKSGAVFLPMAGYRYGTGMSCYGTCMYYQSSEVDGNGNTKVVFFESGTGNPYKNEGKVYGFSVRLVRDVQGPSYGVDVQSACDSITWIDGNTYYESTTTPTFTFAGANVRGEDSIVSLHLTIRHSSYSVFSTISSSPYTWINGVTYNSSNHTATDTLRGVNVQSCDSIVTLNLTIIGNDGALEGDFSVSSNTKVRFSQGNLQYQASTNSWRFAPNQQDMIGWANNRISSSSSEWIDLFGFGTSGWNSGANSYRPYSTSTSNGDYHPGGSSANGLVGTYAYADWGRYNLISNGGSSLNRWRVLTKNEWAYLFNTRPASTVGGTANGRFCKAIINGISGVILFPDNYTHPNGVHAPVQVNNYGVAFSTNIYSLSDWSAMLDSNAVFLPNNGYRSNTSVYGINDYMYYWSSTVYDGNSCYVLHVSNSGGNPQALDGRNFGFGVRLVHEVQGPTYHTDVHTACDSYTWIDGNTYTESNTSATYTIVGGNSTGCDSIITLNLTIYNTTYSRDVHLVSSPYTWIDGNTYSVSNYDATYTYSDGNSHGCDSVVTLSLTMRNAGGANAGVFTVSSGQTVQFSQGNLQYQASTGTWRFAENSYDYIGSGNSGISSSYTGWIDLFGWGTSGWESGANSYTPYSTSTRNTDYYPGGSSSNNITGVYAYSDWGVYNAISNGGNAAGMWRVLTNAEWGYLFNTRSASTINGTSNARYCKARIGTTNGVIVFADSYTVPANVLAPARLNDMTASFTTNIYTTEEWNRLMAAGAIFLPAAGYRGGTGVSELNSQLYYWSSTYLNGDSIKLLYVANSSGNATSSDGRYYGFSVRLVKDVE